MSRISRRASGGASSNVRALRPTWVSSSATSLSIGGSGGAL